MNQSLMVVVADSDPAVLRCLSQWLGHRVTAVADGRTLLAACRAKTPDLVLSDVQMPHLDGLTAAALLRAESAVPIILMSGGWDGAQLAEANALGAACLQKPVGPMALISTMLQAVPGSAGEVPASEPMVRPLVWGAGVRSA